MCLNIEERLSHRVFRIQLVHIAADVEAIKPLYGNIVDLPDRFLDFFLTLSGRRCFPSRKEYARVIEFYVKVNGIF